MIALLLRIPLQIHDELYGCLNISFEDMSIYLTWSVDPNREEDGAESILYNCFARRD